ncbi:MAG: hypothetical protein ACLQUW_06425 [Desulfobaccales bacterium]
MDQEHLKRVVEQTITEELTRFKQDFLLDLGRLVGQLAGCDSQEGCCQQQGCCKQEGCCSRTHDLPNLVGERMDILEEFILSHKEPIVKFFKARGVELGF